MSEFILNRPHWWPKERKFQNVDWDLRDFACGYVEALFFTNGDTGDEDEFSLNRLGAERLTAGARREIVTECAEFLSLQMRALIDASPGGYEQAGHDFWFTRQGLGVGFWDRGEDIWPEEARGALNARAKGFGEAYVYRQNGWIYVG
jgi:hypothetical protein